MPSTIVLVSPRKPHTLDLLPKDVLIWICSFLERRELARLSGVSRWLRHIADSNLVWKRLYEHTIGKPNTREEKEKPSNSQRYRDDEEEEEEEEEEEKANAERPTPVNWKSFLVQDAKQDVESRRLRSFEKWAIVSIVCFVLALGCFLYASVLVFQQVAWFQSYEQVSGLLLSKEIDASRECMDVLYSYTLSNRTYFGSRIYSSGIPDNGLRLSKLDARFQVGQSVSVYVSTSSLDKSTAELVLSSGSCTFRPLQNVSSHVEPSFSPDSFLLPLYSLVPYMWFWTSLVFLLILNPWAMVFGEHKKACFQKGWIHPRGAYVFAFQKVLHLLQHDRSEPLPSRWLAWFYLFGWVCGMWGLGWTLHALIDVDIHDEGMFLPVFFVLLFGTGVVCVSPCQVFFHFRRARGWKAPSIWKEGADAFVRGHTYPIYLVQKHVSHRSHQPAIPSCRLAVVCSEWRTVDRNTKHEHLMETVVSRHEYTCLNESTTSTQLQAHGSIHIPSLSFASNRSREPYISWTIHIQTETTVYIQDIWVH